MRRNPIWREEVFAARAAAHRRKASPTRNPQLAAITFEQGFDVDRLLLEICRQLHSLGALLGGIVQVGDRGIGSRRSSLQAIDLRTGRTSAPTSRGCRLDERGLAEAAPGILDSICAGVDLIVINRFGRAESNGGGLIPSITASLEANIPVLTVVPAPYLEAWRCFHDGLAVDLSPTIEDVLSWAGQAISIGGNGSSIRSTDWVGQRGSLPFEAILKGTSRATLNHARTSVLLPVMSSTLSPQQPRSARDPSAPVAPALLSSWLRRGRGLLHVAAEEAGQPLMLEAKIALKDVSGRIDPRRRSRAPSSVRRRARQQYVDVIDLDKQQPVQRLGGLKEPQGVAYVAATDTVVVANAKDGSVAFFGGGILRRWASWTLATMPTTSAS